MKINTIFAGIEGEGYEIGTPKTFIRFQKCSVHCRGCDSPETQNPDLGIEMTLKQVAKEVKKLNNYHITITGGSPLEQPQELLTLLFELKKEGYFITLEESGQVFNKEIFEKCDFLSLDLKTPSSGVKANIDVLKKALLFYRQKTQIKAVVATPEDYKFVKRIYREISELKRFRFVLTPCWKKGGKLDIIFTRRICSEVLKDKLYCRVIVQQHKVIYDSTTVNV